MNHLECRRSDEESDGLSVLDCRRSENITAKKASSLQPNIAANKACLPVYNEEKEEEILDDGKIMNLSLSAKGIMRNDVIIDSGCSQHCFNNTRWFTYIQELKIIDLMEISNGGYLNIKEIGTVIMPIPNSTFILENAFHYPEGAANIVSAVY